MNRSSDRAKLGEWSKPLFFNELENWQSEMQAAFCMIDLGGSCRLQYGRRFDGQVRKCSTRKV